MNDEDRAQRWHDTDHGELRGKPIRPSRFRIPRPDAERDWVSSCFCCCELCDPDWNPGGRTNPYWTRALASLTADAAVRAGLPSASDPRL